MKKMLLVMVLVFLLGVTPAFAESEATANAGATVVTSQGQTQSNSNTFVPTNTQGQTQSNSFVPTNTQGQGQDQVQGQLNNWSQVYDSPMQLPGAIPVFPNPIPFIQGGRVGDVTAQMVRFAFPATPYGNGDKVVRVLEVIKGSIFDRVRLEDIEIDLIEAFKAIVQKYGSKDFDLAKVKYLVQYKDSVMGSGIGGGGAGSINAIGGGANPLGSTGSAAILPGYARSTADPAYFIKFFQVE